MGECGSVERRALREVLRLADLVVVRVDAAVEAEPDTKRARDFDLVEIPVEVDSARRFRGLGVTDSLACSDIFPEAALAGLTGE